MLHKLRRMVKSWLATALIALLVVSFAAWGIGDVFVSRAGYDVAEVGDRRITTTEFVNAFNARVETISRSDPEFGVSDALEIGLDRQVIENLSRRAALTLAGTDLKLSAPDETVSENIAGQSVFRGASGEFDPARYARVLSTAGFSQKEYEASVREGIATTEVTRALVGGLSVPADPIRTALEWQLEQRTLAYVLVGPDHVSAPDDPTEAEIAEYLESNPDRFQTRERRDVSYLWLSPDTLADPESVSEEDIEDYYHINPYEFGSPAYRTVNLLSFETEGEAEAARQRMLEGTTIDEIAEETGVAIEDYRLGRVTREELPEAMAEAAFATTETGPLPLVKTAFGWSLIDLVAATEAVESPLEEVRDEIATILAREDALVRIPELTGEIEDLRAAAYSLEEVAEELGLTLYSHAGIDRFGIDADGSAITDLPTDPAFLRSVFEAGIEEDRDIEEFADGGVVLLRVEAITESRPNTLDEVRDQIGALLLDEAWQEATLTFAGEIEQRVAGGETLADAAASFGGEEIVSEPFTRDSPLRELGRELVDEVFELAEGEVTAGESTQPRSAVVVRMQAILPADDEIITAQLEPRRERAASSISQDVVELFVDSLLEEYGVAVDQPSIDAALGVIAEQ